jgi:membrane protein YdbS with pleckstrin-like domain
MADVTPASFRHTLRLLCAALLGSQVILLLAVSATMGSSGFDSPPPWAVAVVVALGVVGAVVIPVIGYRVPAIAPGANHDESRVTVVGAVQSSTILRFALSEAVAIASIALAFVVDGGGTIVCLAGVAISTTLGVLHVWPGDRVLSRLKEALEREGGQSDLDAVLDAPPPSRG